MDFSLDEIDRYDRQITLPEWGSRGQERLAAAIVRIEGDCAAVRAAVLYLAAAGVGRIETTAYGLEARSINPHVETVDLPSTARRGAAAILGGGARIATTDDRFAAGSALAVEVVKSLLGLPFNTAPSIEELVG